jgi:hypothetical protein
MILFLLPILPPPEYFSKNQTSQGKSTKTASNPNFSASRSPKFFIPIDDYNYLVINRIKTRSGRLCAKPGLPYNYIFRILFLSSLLNSGRNNFDDLEIWPPKTRISGLNFLLAVKGHRPAIRQ